MALVQQSDIDTLQRKKADLEALVDATSRAYDKAKEEYELAKADLDQSIADGKTNAGPNSSSVDKLIEAYNVKISLPARKISEALVGEDMRYAYGGEQLFEIINPDYVVTHEDNWTTTRADLDKELQSEVAKADADAEIEFNSLLGAISDRDQASIFEDVNMDLRTVYEELFKAAFEIATSSHVSDFTAPIANKWIADNVDNNELLKRFNEEQEERKEAVRESFARQNRKNSILRDNFEDIALEMKDLSSDSALVIAELETEMGISVDGEDGIVKETIKANKENQKIFEAVSALVLTRESLFDLSIGGIIEKIKEACYKGETKIELTGDEISGTEIYALTQSGYKVTHQKISSPGRNKDNTLFTIDWVSAGSK